MINNIFFFEDSYTEFKNWLNSRNPDEIVGKANSFNSCPLSVCTGLAIGEEVFHEKENYIEKYKLPIWAIKFVQLVDDTEKNQLTANDCLSILRKISV